MKIFIFLISFICLLTTRVYNQNIHGKNSDLGRISITPILPDTMDDIHENARLDFRNKLHQILSGNELGEFDFAGRFILTGKVVIITRDILPDIPPVHAYTLDATFFIADAVTKTVFSSTAFLAKGVGIDESQAVINGINNTSINSPQFKILVQEGKEKIIEYYESACDSIISEAFTLVSTDNYKEAILSLMTIPYEALDCYPLALDQVPLIFEKYMNFQCSKGLAAAKLLWAANPNSDGANAIVPYLANIYPDAACHGDAQKLLDEIRKKIRKEEERDWTFMLKEWDDNVSHESQRIKACIDIGVAWINDQPKRSINVNWIFGD